MNAGSADSGGTSSISAFVRGLEYTEAAQTERFLSGGLKSSPSVRLDRFCVVRVRPIRIYTSLYFGDRLILSSRLEQVVEPALRFQVLDDWPSFLRDVGMPQLTVNRLFERPDAGFERQLAI